MCHNLHIACCMNCLRRSGNLGFKIFPQPILDSLRVRNKLPVFIWAFIRYLLFPSLLLFDYSKLCPAEKTLTHQDTERKNSPTCCFLIIHRQKKSLLTTLFQKFPRMCFTISSCPKTRLVESDVRCNLVIW